MKKATTLQLPLLSTELLAFGQGRQSRSHTVKNRANRIDEMIANGKVDIGNSQDLDVVIDLLMKQPSFRHDSEIKILELAFKDNKFVEETKAGLSIDKMRLFYKNLRHLQIPEGKPVFFLSEFWIKLDDYSDYFYIILKGSVFVILPSKPEESVRSRRNKKV